MLQSNPDMNHPRCSQCGSAMRPANVMPGLGDFSHRVFQCVKCGHAELLPEPQTNRTG
jgi:hypothetical protein